jgi:hypothetical protein
MDNFTKNFFDWDGERSEEILLFRRMKWDDPKKLLKQYSKKELKEIFLKHYVRFDKKNQAFWKLILGICDAEIEQKTKGNFGRVCNI